MNIQNLLKTMEDTTMRIQVWKIQIIILNVQMKLLKKHLTGFHSFLFVLHSVKILQKEKLKLLIQNIINL
jgi:hypothetical protein